MKRKKRETLQTLEDYRGNPNSKQWKYDSTITKHIQDDYEYAFISLLSLIPYNTLGTIKDGLLFDVYQEDHPHTRCRCYVMDEMAGIRL